MTDNDPHLDYLNNAIDIGDTVIHKSSTSGAFSRMFVVGFTPKLVRTVYANQYPDGPPRLDQLLNKGHLSDPYCLVCVNKLQLVTDLQKENKNLTEDISYLQSEVSRLQSIKMQYGPGHGGLNGIRKLLADRPTSSPAKQFADKFGHTNWKHKIT
jgi:hypothetical protein